MSKLLEGYDRFVKGVTYLAALLAGICILVTALIVVYEVIMRGIFRSPTEWVLEISTYLILVSALLGLAITFRMGGHIQVDFLISRLSAKTQCILEIIWSAMAVVLFCIFVSESTGMVEMSYHYNKLSPSILRFPLYIPQLALVIGGLLLLLEIINKFLLDVNKLMSGSFTSTEKEAD